MVYIIVSDSVVDWMKKKKKLYDIGKHFLVNESTALFSTFSGGGGVRRKFTLLKYPVPQVKLKL